LATVRNACSAIAVALLIAVPFLHNGYLTGLLVVVAIDALAATGLGLLVGAAGEVSLAQAAFMGIGAYATALLAGHGWNAWLAIIGAGAVVVALAAVVGYPTLRLRGHYLTLATLGLGIIVFVALNEASPLTGGPSGYGDYPSLRIGALRLSGDVPFYVLAWLCVALAVIGGAALRASWRGRALRAISASEVAAASVGVSVRARKLEAFVLSAVAASLAGSIYAFYVGFISPTSFGFEQSVFLLVMVVLGGAETATGPVFGSLLFVIANEVLQALGSHLFPSTAQSAVAALQIVAFGIVLIVVMRLLPRGVAGAWLEKVAR